MRARNQNRDRILAIQGGEETDGNGSSSDTSSASTSAKSDSDVEVVMETKPEEPEASQQKVVQAHSRRPDVGRMWGPFRLTPSGAGYQLTCTHPEHQTGSVCSRTRSSNISGEASALHMLKRWAQLGYECGSKAAHKEMWQVVREEDALGQLPDLAELDAWAEDVEF